MENFLDKVQNKILQKRKKFLPIYGTFVHANFLPIETLETKYGDITVKTVTYKIMVP